MKNKKLEKFLKGYIPQEQKRFFKPKSIGLEEARYEDFSIEEQNLVCQKVLEDKRNIWNYVKYLEKKNLFANLTPENIANLMEAQVKCSDPYILYDDGEKHYSLSSYAPAVLDDIEKYVPKEKRKIAIKKLLPLLRDEEKLIAYTMVQESDQDDLREEMGYLLSKESLITHIRNMLKYTINPQVSENRTYLGNDDWIGLHAEKVLDYFKDNFSMDEMDKVFSNLDTKNTDVVGILFRNNERVSPVLLGKYKDKFTPEELKNIIEKNMKKFDWVSHEFSDNSLYLTFSNLDYETQAKFDKMGKAKKELIEKIESLPQEERFEAMKKVKDYLYCGDIFILNGILSATINSYE